MEITDVAAALIRRGDTFLICRRPAGKKRALCWEFPGGKREPGETAREAAERECEEELGVRIRVGEEYMTVLHEYPDIHIRLLLYEAELEKGEEPRLREHADMRWITPAQIPDFEFCPADRDILAKIRKDAEEA